jgi:hypothetical protein
MIVGLKQVGDLDLIENESVLADVCNADDRPRVLAMASLVERLFDKFDYESSPEFLSKLDGRSETLRAMQIKLLTAEKKKQLAERFGCSLTQILCSQDAYVLVPPDSHADLDELKAMASSIAK